MEAASFFATQEQKKIEWTAGEASKKKSAIEADFNFIKRC